MQTFAPVRYIFFSFDGTRTLFFVYFCIRDIISPLIT